MTYTETLHYLFESLPTFQLIGEQAYKPGLANSMALDAYFNHPHTCYKTIHVGGTNGKGSVAHTLAAILQEAGYRVGLYTSPHLLDFSERIRVNGTPIDQQYVIDFVAQHQHFFEPLQPSFFELTTAMAFLYFAEQKVDIAVIEVGLGGRLDCTNIISPDLSIITSISLDHTNLLGNTLQAIAREKAGIMKPFTPVVVGEVTPDPEDERRAAQQCFVDMAQAQHAPLIDATATTDLWIEPELELIDQWQLQGSSCSLNNYRVLIAALNALSMQHYRLTAAHIQAGFEHVCDLTGLRGRWQTIGTHPLTICDIAHNVAGIRQVVQALHAIPHRRLHMVFGVAKDKDLVPMLGELPPDATYYLTQASVDRAMPAKQLQEKAIAAGLRGETYPTVIQALQAARAAAAEEDLIFVGGSNFVVADLLSELTPLA